jgi:hypothetical protein
MTQKERLADHLRECEKIEHEYLFRAGYDAEKIIELCVDYLLDNGVIVPPCKVGDWVWHICRGKINKAKIEECRYSASKHGHFSDDWLFHAFDFKVKEEVSFWRDDIGETVFLTREEADAAFKDFKERSRQ